MNALHRQFIIEEMPRKLFLLIFTVLLLMIAACSGRQPAAQDSPASKFQPRTRFIPEDKKNLFIGSIFNLSLKTGIETRLREKLAASFLLSRDLVYTQSYASAEIYAGIDILEVSRQEFMYDVQTDKTKNRWFLRFKLTLKDPRTNMVWIDGVEIGVSSVEIVDSIDAAFSEQQALDQIFEKVYLNIDSYIRKGSPYVDTRYGYEDIPTVNDPLFQSIKSSSSSVADDFQEGEDTAGLTDEQKREIEIRARDENGGQSGVR